MTNIRHLRALQAFDVAATRKSLSKAANDLGVTHGAVSRQIKQLEHYLDVTLLHRLPGGVDLTDAGARLHLATQDAFTALEKGIAATKRTQRRRTVTISLSSSLAIKWLVPKLQDFRTRHPGISVLLDTDDHYTDFSNSDVDVALRYGSGEWHDMVCERLNDEHLIAVAAPSILPKGPASPAAIAHLPLLHDQFHPHWDTWAKAVGLAASGFQSKSAAFPDSAVLIAAALDGQGAMLVRQILVADDIKAGRLVRLSDTAIEQDKALYFICRDGDQRSPPIRALHAWLVEICDGL